MVTKVFIDGEAGTTGLQIRTRLQARADIHMISLDDTRRKDESARAEAFAEADIGILCLPDAAAIEAVKLAGDTRLIDASTAHRVDPDWVYGMAELPGQKERIAGATRVANVGCYATGSIALVRPLRDADVISGEVPHVITGMSGYSGGGKRMIAEYEPEQTGPDLFLYATGQTHKHVPEIMKYGQLARQPMFQPAVGSYHQGMVVQVHLPKENLAMDVTAAQLEQVYGDFYAQSPFISVAPPQARLSVTALNGTNNMQITVHGNEKKGLFTVTALLDNLGKGASGAAVQNLNIMTGQDETLGL